MAELRSPASLEVSSASVPSEGDRGELYVCTWLYAESEADESTYPQVPGRSSSEDFQATYWRCVAVFFASSFRHQPSARHVLFTNVDRLPTISGVDLRGLLDRLGVEIVRLPLTHETPPGHYHAWRNQFYVFDIVRYLSRQLRERDAAIVLDSDCVWIGDAGPIHEAIDRDGLLAYVESYPVDWPANRMTRDEMRVLAADLLGRQVEHPLVYCGGEFLAASGTELRRVDTEIAMAWTDLLARYDRGDTVFTEEAQMLSYIYYKLGYAVGNGDPYVRRIWTGSLGGFNTALPHDHGLVVWHLPLEKRFGIRRLFGQVADTSSRFWSVPPGRELRDYFGAMLGVPRNSRRKSLRDLGRRASDRLRYR